MNASELVVEVRDVNLARVAQLTEADLSGLIVATRQNDVGSWQLTLPDTVLDEATGQWIEHAAAQHLRKEGAGIVVTAPGPGTTFETLISGPMTSATYVADENDLTGKWSFTGVSDLVLLADGVAFPQPTNADPSTQTKSHDQRTGTAEDLIRQYVAYNICGTHAPAGRIVGLRSRLTLRGTSQGRGPSLTKSVRFENLLELCQSIAFQGGLNFDIVQVGSSLELVITTPTDRTKTIRMDMANQLLKSVTYGYGAPTTTVAVVAGQGEGTDRRILSRTSDEAASAETRWGRRVERFIDQRQTDVDAELIQKGDEEVLAGAASATGLQAAPTDTDAMLYLRDWRTGDYISVVVEGQEVAAKVTEAAISVDGSAVVFVATLGDPGAFDVDAASDRRANATNSRVSALERVAEVPAQQPAAWADITGKPSTFPPSSHSHTWASITSKPSTFAPSAHTHAGSDLVGDIPLANLTAVVARGTTAERDAFYGDLSTSAKRVALANRRVVWFNTDLGWEESYYVPQVTGLTAPALVPGAATGWYPTGTGPRLVLATAGSQAMTANTNFTNWNTPGTGLSYRTGPAGQFIDHGSPGYAFTHLAGRYEAFLSLYVQNGSGTAVFSLRANHNLSTAYQVQQKPVPLLASYGQVFEWHMRDLEMKAGGLFFARCDAGSLAAGAGWSELSVKYLGPPLVQS
ncbi:minor tail protein [Microbacterium phage Percival]|uniref:Minor tail protein n=1 Tax=Microbacterium phage Percival TaxID=2201439 RepID=A0A2Z4Q751_9CAUD|nr:minor tail protein [Microbacterium phage Percival]